MLYNVSTQNLANGVTTVGELVALAHEMEGMKSDELVPANQLQLLATTDDELHAAIPSGTPFGAAVSPLSTHAFYQLCGKLNMRRPATSKASHRGLPHHTSIIGYKMGGIATCCCGQ